MPSENTEENDVGDVLLQQRGNSGTTITNANRTVLEPIPSPARDEEALSQMLEADDEVPVGVLETTAQRKARRRSHFVVYFTTFVMSIGFSIVLTGVWPYLKELNDTVSKEFLGWVVAANPLGQMLASPTFGLWANKTGSNRGAFIWTVLFFVMGNILYAVLPAFDSVAPGVMIFSRFVVGVSSANIAIIRSYVAASTTMKERTTALSLISAAQGLGFIIGPPMQAGLVIMFSESDNLNNQDGSSSTPLLNSTGTAIQAALAVAFEEEQEATNSTLNGTPSYDEEDDGSPRVVWDMYTTTGWLAALLGFLNIFLFLPCIYQEHPIAAKEAQYQKRIANGNNVTTPKPDYLMLFVILITFFIILTIYVLIETLLVPMTMDLYAWNDKTAIKVIGIGLSISGVISVFVFASIGMLSRKFDERKLLVFLGLVPLLLSTICFFPMGSTYPKMQNCTVETQAGILPSLDKITTPFLDHSEIIETTTLLPISLREAETLLETPLSEEETTTTVGNTDLVTESSSNLPNDDINFIEPRNHSSPTPLSRRRRHVGRHGTCHDLGCPPDQAWCYYTPIIEQSQLIVACLVAVVGYPVAMALCSTLFSKLLGPTDQGVWMGILTSTGSFSRVVGPIFVSYMYTTLGTRWTFGVLFFVLAFNIIIVLSSMKRLVPMKIIVS